jgi:hypothetical protein
MPKEPQENGNSKSPKDNKDETRNEDTYGNYDKEDLEEDTGSQVRDKG